MRDQSGLWLRSMLPALLRANVLSEDTRIFLPNLPTLLDETKHLSGVRRWEEILPVAIRSLRPLPPYRTQSSAAPTSHSLSHSSLEFVCPFVCCQIRSPRDGKDAQMSSKP